MLDIECDSCIKLVEFIVVKESKSVPILGLETCLDLDLIRRVQTISTPDTVNDFLEQNKDVFTGLGCFPDICKLKLKSNAVPRACPARRVPFKIKDKLKEALGKLEKQGIIVPADEPSEWTNNLVIVEKPDSSLRICIDPTYLNQYLLRDYYEIPTLEEMSLKLTNKSYFCSFDLKQGFHQVLLDAESSKLCTFSTPFGVFRYCRAPFGLCVMPEIFQKITQKYFGNINGVVVYFDDILCAADTKEELEKIVSEVLLIARKNNIRFNPEKLQYFVDSVKFLGFLFNKEGHRPDSERIESIKNLEPPKNKKELQSILGMVNFLRNFLPNLSEVTSPLRNLLKNDVHWDWYKVHEDSLNRIKEMICNVTLLSSFNPNEEIQIQADASKDAIGCSLLQNGKPVLHASRSLTYCEIQYAQIEKELLAVTFAFNKFHNYVYGHKNVICYTDHSPLTSIVNKDICKIRNNRLRRLRLKLMHYDFKLKYLPGKLMSMADLLSRNVKRNPVNDDFSMQDRVHTLEVGCLTFSKEKLENFQQESKSDQVLSQVIQFYNEGWPKQLNCNSELNHYFKIRNSINVENGLVYSDEKLIVPSSLRKFVTVLLHETHIGFEKTKQKAKQFFYWPGMLSDLRNYVTSCMICQRFQRSNIKDKLMLHEIPDIPFYKIAMDIAEYRGLYYLVLIDYYSRWVETEQIRDKSSLSVINALKPIFSRYGIPAVIIADNNPFGSFELKEFARQWNFEIRNTSPYHSQSNGLAEKAVGIVKKMLQKCNYEGNESDLSLYLLNYRNFPVAGLDYSPAQLLMNRNLRTKLPLHKNKLYPRIIKDPAVTLKNKQEEYYNRTSRKTEEEFEANEIVLVQNKFTKIWEEGIIVRKADIRSYLVKVNGKYFRRNKLLIKKLRKFVHEDLSEKVGNSITQPMEPSETEQVQNMQGGPNSNQTDTSGTEQRSRYGRIIKRPKRLDL